MEGADPFVARQPGRIVASGQPGRFQLGLAGGPAPGVARTSGGAVGAGETLKARSRARARGALCRPLLCLGQQLGVVPGDLFDRVQERGAGLDGQRAAPDVPPVPQRVGCRAVVLGGFLDGEVARQRLVHEGALSQQVGWLVTIITASDRWLSINLVGRWMFHGQPVPRDRVYGLTFGRGVSRNLAVRMSAEQDPQGGSWAAREAAGIGQRVARRRAAMRLSAQQVADRSADLGMPGLTRQVLARLETGRRESVSTAELAVIAAALETAPLLLLYPGGPAETVEVLPGNQAPPYDAARCGGGEAALSARRHIAPPTPPAPPTPLPAP